MTDYTREQSVIRLLKPTHEILCHWFTQQMGFNLMSKEEYRILERSMTAYENAHDEWMREKWINSTVLD